MRECCAGAHDPRQLVVAHGITMSRDEGQLALSDDRLAWVQRHVCSLLAETHDAFRALAQTPEARKQLSEFLNGARSPCMMLCTC